MRFYPIYSEYITDHDGGGILEVCPWPLYKYNIKSSKDAGGKFQHFSSKPISNLATHVSAMLLKNVDTPLIKGTHTAQPHTISTPLCGEHHAYQCFGIVVNTPEAGMGRAYMASEQIHL